MPRVVELRVPSVDAELAADRMWAAGAQAVEVIDAPDEVALRSVLSDDDDRSRQRLGPLPTGWRVAFLDVADAPSEAWRDFATPIDVSASLVIRPAWLPPRRSADDVLEVAIEPGGAFGLGDHPTTRLSAAAVERLVTAGARVLDVGCGSGVLSVIAARSGADHVTAIDIAEAAREATLANAAANRVADRVAASTDPLAEVDGAFDLVLANILAPALVSLAPDLVRVTRPGGALVVSGVLAGGYDHVVSALAPLDVVQVDELDGWVAIELRRGR